MENDMDASTDFDVESRSLFDKFNEKIAKIDLANAVAVPAAVGALTMGVGLAADPETVNAAASAGYGIGVYGPAVAGAGVLLARGFTHMKEHIAEYAEGLKTAAKIGIGAAAIIAAGAMIAPSAAHADGFGTAGMSAPTPAENLGKPPEFLNSISDGAKKAGAAISDTAKNVSDSQKGGYEPPKEKAKEASSGKPSVNGADVAATAAGAVIGAPVMLAIKAGSWISGKARQAGQEAQKEGGNIFKTVKTDTKDPSYYDTQKIGPKM